MYESIRCSFFNCKQLKQANYASCLLAVLGFCLVSLLTTDQNRLCAPFADSIVLIVIIGGLLQFIGVYLGFECACLIKLPARMNHHHIDQMQDMSLYLETHWDGHLQS